MANTPCAALRSFLKSKTPFRKTPEGRGETSLRPFRLLHGCLREQNLAHRDRVLPNGDAAESRVLHCCRPVCTDDPFWSNRRASPYATPSSRRSSAVKKNVSSSSRVVGMYERSRRV